MKVIPVATTWRLIEVDTESGEELDTAFDSLEAGSGRWRVGVVSRVVHC